MNHRNLTFVVSGMLWQRSLVMLDLDTRSLWSHLLGTCMRGSLAGEQLERFPAVMTDWKTWRTQHPDTTVLMMSRTTADYRRDFYRDPSQFVLGMAEGEAARAWPFDQLILQPVVNDQFLGQPILVVFDSSSSTAAVFDRRARGRTLSFSIRRGQLIDRQTGSQWERTTGRATAGPLEGTRLKPLVGIPSYRRAWRVFHPESRYWRAD